MSDTAQLTPDDPRITAYALGELEAAEVTAVEAWLLDHPEGRVAVDEIRRTALALEAAFAAEPVDMDNSIGAGTVTAGETAVKEADAPGEKSGGVRAGGEVVRFESVAESIGTRDSGARRGGWRSALSAAGFAAAGFAAAWAVFVYRDQTRMREDLPARMTGRMQVARSVAVQPVPMKAAARKDAPSTDVVQLSAFTSVDSTERGRIQGSIGEDKAASFGSTGAQSQAISGGAASGSAVSQQVLGSQARIEGSAQAAPYVAAAALTGARAELGVLVVIDAAAPGHPESPGRFRTLYPYFRQFGSVALYRSMSANPNPVVAAMGVLCLVQAVPGERAALLERLGGDPRRVEVVQASGQRTTVVFGELVRRLVENPDELFPALVPASGPAVHGAGPP